MAPPRVARRRKAAAPSNTDKATDMDPGTTPTQPDATPTCAGTSTEPDATPTSTQCAGEPTWTQRVLGFERHDVTTWSALTAKLHAPCDPASLAAFRIGFGVLMTIDILEERGLAYLDFRWGNPSECRFPLVHSMPILSIEYMYLIYLIMLLGAVGIALGFLFRVSCAMFAIPYWYVFLLDKTAWNNHSYLYGLTGLMLLPTGANHWASLDGLIWPQMRNTHVPLWNYVLLRTQYFMVYFIAGLKKLDSDWVGGFSMKELSKHWVFDPFTYLIPSKYVDLVMVHWCGLMLDLFVGFLLFLDATRPVALFFCLQFHAMNSQLFSIGMFPYAMIASNLLFVTKDFPRRVMKRISRFAPWCVPCVDEPQKYMMCVYPDEVTEPTQGEERKGNSTHVQVKDRKKYTRRLNWWQQMSVIGVVTYLTVQSCLPYSHGVTKGYNNWVQGLYGYSWDMMIHSWSTQHLRITYRDKDTGHMGYLNPEAWAVSRNRWSSHADMLVQHAGCVQRRLADLGHPNIELYYDVWRSLNDRFQQRQFDPRVDILSAPWHPLLATPWVMPLLTELSGWRGRLAEIERDIYKNTSAGDVVFIADFPGLYLENYLQPELVNTTMEVLQGEVVVEVLEEGWGNTSLSAGERMTLPAAAYHNVHTVSSSASCYMYTFQNVTHDELERNIQLYAKLKAAEANADAEPHTDFNSEPLSHAGDSTPSTQLPTTDASDDPTSLSDMTPEERFTMDSYLMERDRLRVLENSTLVDKLMNFAAGKLDALQRSVTMTQAALHSLWLGQPMRDVLKNMSAQGETPIFSGLDNWEEPVGTVEEVDS